MNNKIYFGDNLPILEKMESEFVDLIYIDPPFNTKKTQRRTTVKTVRDDNGDRRGFQGNTYRTIELGTKTYEDSFDSLTEFLRPRLVEAYRILKSHGSLYFHIDYREVHYCKILLDEIFGKECFLNEIIWAYDYGGRARTKWPAKHDNILFYVKDPKKYIFNTNEIDREPYMAPGLVGSEKAGRGKTPTDTWWPQYTGTKKEVLSDTWWLNYTRGQNDTWWQTIVPTNSRERKGYPTQKPQKLIDRILKASSHRGSVVLDFFAGSGTVGDSCLSLNRNFILIDNNLPALEVMAQRFSGVKNIDWINFNPKIAKSNKKPIITKVGKNRLPQLSDDFIMIAATASHLQEEIDNNGNPWENSPFEWVLKLPPARKGKLGGDLIASWLKSKGLHIDPTKDSTKTIVINRHKIALKFSTLWANGVYKFQQIRDEGYDFVLCLGISPFNAHCWVLPREFAIKHATRQHKGTEGYEYWMTIDPLNPPEWTQDYGGTLNKAYQILRKINAKKRIKT